MVESSDLQSAIQRTQATERVQALQNQQEELERKRFELSIARERAEKAKKAQDVERARHKRVVRDRYDGDEEQNPRDDQPGRAPQEGPDREAAEEAPGRHEAGPGPEGTGGIDVRV
jgi:hypothetical protein